MSEKPAPPRRSLGRGLDALLGTLTPSAQPAPVAAAAATAAATAPPPPRAGLARVPISAIRPGRVQPRHRFEPAEIEELAQSIREKGVLQPVLVRPAAGDASHYEIIAGERRWRAAQLAQLHEIPVIIRDLSDGEALEVALVENLQRADLSPIEEAQGYERLMQEFRHTQEDLARVIGKSRSHLANQLRLLTLPGLVKALIDDGRLSPGHARLLVGIDDGAAVAAAQSWVDRRLSVREAERMIKQMKTAGEANATAASPGRREPRSPDIVALERDLAGKLGLAVEIHPRGEAGHVLVRYKTLEQLDDLIAVLGQGGGKRR
jgi:ParB family chromosome partitioning protein